MWDMTVARMLASGVGPAAMGLESAACAVSFVLAVYAYINTLPAQFAFDDNFAVVGDGRTG
jgi:hypothetical protein